MAKILIGLVLGLVIGAAVVLSSNNSVREQPLSVPAVSPGSTAISGFEAEISRLRADVLRLEEELAMARRASVQPGAAPAEEVAALADAIRSNRVVRAPAEPDDLVQQLIAAGFAPDRAEWINDRSAELMMELIADRNEQLRQNPAATALNMPEQKLRQELGDAEYERYLLALGREPYANILDVIDNSPAATAGLQAGDQIAYYDGRRVFDFLEITPLTMEGTPGEPVIVDIVRDGQPMQLFVPRGPLGLRLGGTPVPIPEPFVPPQ